MHAVSVTGEETMRHSPDPRCFATATVSESGRFYPYCTACGWESGPFEADQHDAARLEADGHSDPEVLKEMAEWVRMLTEQRDDSHFPPYPEDPIEDSKI